MKTISFSIILLILSFSSNGQKQAYKIYSSKGKEVSFEKMTKSFDEVDILLFGEQHNNPIAHWLQYELTFEMQKIRSLILGAEMIEADNQEALDKYLLGEVSDKQLDTMARLWPNYKTDYAPLVNLAKENDLPFIATNVPRRYAKLVYKGGFEILDTLPEGEKAWIAPLPIAFDSELPNYKKILEMSHGHGSPALVKAQALKDATMAFFILHNYVDGALFVHYNGAYHSNNHEGIVWYLNQGNPNLRYMTISTVEQGDIDKLLPENMNLADFIICVDEDMTKTY